MPTHKDSFQREGRSFRYRVNRETVELLPPDEMSWNCWIVTFTLEKSMGMGNSSVKS